MSVAEVTVDELATAMAAGARVVDVREIGEFEGGHVPGAVHVALSTVPDRVDAFNGAGATYVICKSGARSRRACEFLAGQGVSAINVAGGTDGWVASGREVLVGSRSE